MTLNFYHALAFQRLAARWRAYGVSIVSKLLWKTSGRRVGRPWTPCPDNWQHDDHQVRSRRCHSRDLQKTSNLFLSCNAVKLALELIHIPDTNCNLEFAFMKTRCVWLGLLAALFCGPAFSADLDRAEVERRLAKADKSHPADLRRKDLTGLDLSNLDFRNADLWGSDLRRANFSNSNLSGLNLDLTVMSKINLSGANLSNTSIFGVHMGSADLSNANLSGSRFIANLDRSNLSRANLSHANWGVDMKNQPMGLMRVSLNNVNLSGANLSDADLNRALMRHANLSGSLLKNAVLFGVDLSGADLTNADLSGADLSESRLEDANFAGANLAGARFAGVRNKSAIKGLDSSKNLDSAIFDH